MEKFQLKTSNRDIAIKPDALRKQGLMPAELYGNKQANQHLSVSQNEFEKVLRKAGESTVVDLVTDDGKAHNVLIHDVQRHFLTSRPIHVDFYEVSMTEKLTANVALEFVGEAPAVRTHGGTLVKTLDAVEVESLPADLPHNITVDVSGLAELTDVIHVKDLPVPARVTIVTDGEELVVKVQPPRDVEAELSAPVVEDISAVVGAAEDKPEAVEDEAASKEE